MARPNKKGRRDGMGRFLALPADMLKTPAWLSLGAAARAALVQVGARYNGANNGYLAASIRDLAAECNLAKDTANKAVRELVARGFLEVVQEGSFSFKKRHAAEYRLTWRPCDRTRTPPSRAYLRPPEPLSPHG
jgi:hypothetical protein